MYKFATGILALHFFNPFPTNAPLLYPLKTSENLGFSDVFRGYRSAALVEIGLKLNYTWLSDATTRDHNEKLTIFQRYSGK